MVVGPSSSCDFGVAVGGAEHSGYPLSRLGWKSSIVILDAFVSELFQIALVQC